MASQSRGRLLLLAAPLSAVVVVVLGVISGGERPSRSARVYSGPTQGLTELSLRVELGERDRVAELPLVRVPFEVVALEGGRRVASARATTDELGMAEVALRLPRARDSALELWVASATTEQASLARGLVLGRADAFRRAPRRGGFQGGRRSGELELAVAPAHGVLVTAQGALDDELVIRALRGGSPAPDTRVRVELEGGEPGVAHVVTDPNGLSRLRVHPQDPVLRVSLSASTPGGASGGLLTRLVVVPGAIRATRRGDHLLLETGGAASDAFVVFFDEQRRYVGLHAGLTPAPDGRLVAEVPWPTSLPSSPLWAVTSSQADLASPSAIGWPVSSTAPDPRTFDVRELLLMDGAVAARAREEKRVRRIRLVTAAYAAAALLVTLGVFLRRVRRSQRDIQRHLSAAGLEGAASIAQPAAGRTALAVACIGLGFLVVTVWAVLRD